MPRTNSANKDIRTAAFMADIPLWKLAKKLGYSESGFSRKLRCEMGATDKGKCLAAIGELKAEKGGEKNA